MVIMYICNFCSFNFKIDFYLGRYMKKKFNSFCYLKCNEVVNEICIFCFLNIFKCIVEIFFLVFIF